MPHTIPINLSCFRLAADGIMVFGRVFRQQKLTFKEIGKLMGLTGSRAAVLSNHIDFKIENQKQRRINNELKVLIKKFG